ncbi:hypothetical protein PG984_012096 [Apiospora sp. TS-2023a]
MPASNAIGGPERQTLGDAAGSAAQTGIATSNIFFIIDSSVKRLRNLLAGFINGYKGHLPFLVTINPAPEFKPNTTNKQGDNSTTMDFSAFAQLDLPPIPENPTMDFDLFGSFNNQDVFNPSTFDSLHPDSTTETATASLDSRVEEGMATKDQLDQVATSIDHGFECLGHAVSEAMQSIHKLRDGLRPPEDKLKLLQKENQQLCRKLDSIQSQCEAKDRHVRHLEAEIARYREQCNKQNKAVEHIADTIALAFRDYQDITGTQPSREVAQQPNTVDEISITYADVISAWSDSSLE